MPCIAVFSQKGFLEMPSRITDGGILFLPSIFLKPLELSTVVLRIGINYALKKRTAEIEILPSINFKL